MEKVIFLISPLFIFLNVYSQNNIQIKDQRIEIHAVQYDESVKLEIEEYGISIDYDSGDFIASIDLENSNLYAEEKEIDRIPGDEVIEINGNIPIFEILDNESAGNSQIYELEVNYTDYLVTTAFEFTTSDIPTSQQDVKFFQVRGAIDLREFGIEDLKGYEPKIILYLEFFTYLMGN